MMSSIRLRLFLILLAATGAVWLLAVLWTYLSTQHEVERVLDARLTEAARMVSSLITDHRIDVAAAVEAAKGSDLQASFDMPAGDYSRQLSCQIWSLQGDLVSRSGSAPNASLADHEQGFAEKIVNGERWRVYAVVNPELGVRVLVGDNIEIRERLVGDVIKGQLVPALAMLPILAGLIWFSVGRGLAPLSRMAETLSLRSAEELHSLDDSGAPREVRPLLRSLNALFQRVQEARDREKTFIAYAAHELKTPLAGLKTQAQVALRSDSDEVRDRALSQISTSVDRTSRLVRQLIDLAAVDSLEGASAPEVVDVADLVQDLVSEMTSLRSARDITVATDIEPGLRIEVADQTLLRLALRNIIENALQYTPAGSEVQVLGTSSNSGLIIDVVDLGPGIAKDEEARIMERFHRGTLAEGHGSGLGLPIVEMALAKLGGRLEFVRAGNDGFCVRMLIPSL